MNNNYPNLEKRYEDADIMMKLEVNMINAIENRVIQRSRHYIRDFKLKKLREK